ncbi:MAG: class I SAM-dependent methyltransferase [Candidatus Edwardsbacteria bacterium]|nr:class I SAM-dependent methyltransferase [Candidatus Edwardsbacteria bacterium]
MSRNLSGSDLAWWNQRYVRQAEWTRALRFHLYRRLGIARCRKILELGCGTGVIAGELADRTDSDVFGLDNDEPALMFARERTSNKRLLWLSGSAEKLPLGDESVDLIITHYFWLWAGRPDVVCNECRRVLKKGGKLAALAEPDYSKRIDHPDTHSGIKEFLSDDLREKGADPDIGGKLKDIFSGVGLKVETGSANDKVAFRENQKMFHQEWELLGKLGFPADELVSIKKNPKEKWMIMPVHWAIGRKR